MSSQERTMDKCYVCGAPVVSGASYEGSADFEITAEMVRDAAFVLAESDLPDQPNDLKGWWALAERVLRTAMSASTQPKVDAG